MHVITPNLDIKLEFETPSEWFSFVEKDFNSFLLDHAACERKASATGVSMICKYPDRPELIEPMLNLAREELGHFHQVCRFVLKRGLHLIADEKDPYIHSFSKNLRHGRDEGLLDRLLMFGIVEKRGHERFFIVAQNIKDPELKHFYEKLCEAEARHHELFVSVAYKFFNSDEISSRLAELIKIESEITRNLPLRSAVH